MRLVEAKCPNCGANIEVSPDAETTRCRSCGSAILVEDAIQKFKIEVTGQVSMSGLSSVENDIERGNQCLAARDWQSAFKMFTTAVNKQANNYLAWMGCLSSISQNFNLVDFSWVQFSGAIGLETIAQNCLRYSPKEQLSYTKSKISNVSQLIHKAIDFDAEIKRSHAQKVRRGWAIFFFVDTLFMFKASLEAPFIPVVLIFALFSLIIGLLLLIRVKPDKYYNQAWINSASAFDQILGNNFAKV